MVAALNEGPAVFDVGIHNNVLVVRAQKYELDTTGRDVMMSALHNTRRKSDRMCRKDR